jgi:betaine-homocysteine S-methyltransferase
MSEQIVTMLQHGAVLGDGGYLLELERRGYVDSGSGREKVGTGRGSGQYTPEVAIKRPEALRELHREFLDARAQVLQVLTFFGTRETLAGRVWGADRDNQPGRGPHRTRGSGRPGAGGRFHLAHAVVRA